MGKIEKLGSGVQRTRRNLTKAAGVVVSALFALSARSKTAQAQHHDHPCFLRGTGIRTARSYRKVEDLQVGDFLPTTFGGSRPIEWIGRYAFTRTNQTQPWAMDLRPVRIMRSALDDDVPNTDLYVTAAHALYLDGVLIPASSLVNGTTITLDEADESDELEFFHIKLENHDVIDAEGALCESLLAVDENADNFADYVRRFGAPKPAESPCAPLLSFVGGRSEAKSRLRSAVSPLVDRRQKLDIIRDHLEERGIALCGNAVRPRQPLRSARRMSF